MSSRGLRLCGECVYACRILQRRIGRAPDPGRGLDASSPNVADLRPDAACVTRELPTPAFRRAHAELRWPPRAISISLAAAPAIAMP